MRPAVHLVTPAPTPARPPKSTNSARRLRGPRLGGCRPDDPGAGQGHDGAGLRRRPGRARGARRPGSVRPAEVLAGVEDGGTDLVTAQGEVEDGKRDGHHGGGRGELIGGEDESCPGAEA